MNNEIVGWFLIAAFTIMILSLISVLPDIKRDRRRYGGSEYILLTVIYIQLIITAAALIILIAMGVVVWDQ